MRIQHCSIRHTRADTAKILGRFLCVLSLLLLGFSVYAHDYIAHKSWLEDPSGHLTLSDVQQLPGKEFSQALSLGYGASVIWLRLRIDPSHNSAGASDSSSLILRIRPVYLDDIQVFDALAQNGVISQLGDQQHPRLDAMQGQDFLLPILRGNAPRDIWLRLSSTSTRQIHAEVLDQKELELAVLHEHLLFNIYVGAVVVLMLWGLVGWMIKRESLLGAFAFKEFTALLFALSSMGFIRSVWPTEWSAQTLDTLSSLLSVLGVVGALFFYTIFMKDLALPRVGMRILHTLLTISIVLLGAVMLGYTREALQINMLLILISPMVLLGLTLSARAWSLQNNDPTKVVLPRRVMVGFYSLILLLLLVSSSTSLGWVQPTIWTIYIVQLHGLFSSILLLIMLQYRAHMMNVQRQQTIIDLASSRLQAEHDQQLRHEQEKMIDMLAHEIKTPLAIMQMRLQPQASGAKEMRQAMRDMSSIIERCIQATRFADSALVPKVEQQDLLQLTLEAVAVCLMPEQVSIDLPDGLQLHTDGQLLFIIINNLLENACKYSAADTPIKVSARLDPVSRSVQYVVQNTPGNAGWPDPQKIFSKYYRSPHAQRQPGTGLGLYLVKHLVDLLGGEISYQPNTDSIQLVVNLPIDAKVTSQL